MNIDSKIYVAGHSGMVGSAILRRLEREGFHNLEYRSSGELDLTNAISTDTFFEGERPEYVFLAAAKVGGIHANDRYPADFIRINLQMQTNVIDAACRYGVKKLLFLGSSCIYPKRAPQPMKEEHLLTGKLEPTNDAYAMAKIAGIMMCKSYNRQHGTNFVAAMPTNLYGSNDNFDPETSHALPSMVRKFHDAKEEGESSVTLWGTGNPRREFMYVDDLADALVFMMKNFDANPGDPDDVFLNVGVGEDVTIRELAELIQNVIGFEGELVWDPSMPDGTPRKLLDVSRMKEMGWTAQTSLRRGIERTYHWYLENVPKPPTRT